MQNKPSDLIRIAEARTLLEVSHTKMAELLKAGHIRHFTDLLDKRVKLVSKQEILALKKGRVAA